MDKSTEVCAQIVDSLITGPDQYEVSVICRSKEQRAAVLRALRDAGVNINIGRDRSWYTNPDSPACDFAYPHVRITRSSISCTYATPGERWYEAYDFISRFSALRTQDEGMEAPALPDFY